MAKPAIAERTLRHMLPVKLSGGRVRLPNLIRSEAALPNKGNTRIPCLSVSNRSSTWQSYYEKYGQSVDPCRNDHTVSTLTTGPIRWAATLYMQLKQLTFAAMLTYLNECGTNEVFVYVP